MSLHINLSSESLIPCLHDVPHFPIPAYFILIMAVMSTWSKLVRVLLPLHCSRNNVHIGNNLTTNHCGLCGTGTMFIPGALWIIGPPGFADVWLCYCSLPVEHLCLRHTFDSEPPHSGCKFSAIFLALDAPCLLALQCLWFGPQK